MTTSALSARASRTPYPSAAPLRVARLLDGAVRDALRQLRDACPRSIDHDAGQSFTDAVKGRHIGTLALNRMLFGARRAGAPRDAALQIVRAIEGVIGAIWIERTTCTELALEAETVAQAHADAAQLRAVLRESSGSLDDAIERTQRAITAQQVLMATLVHARALQGR